MMLSREIVKKAVCNKLTTRKSNLENKIPDSALKFNSTQITKILKKKIIDVDKKVPDVSGLMTITV